jgi:DNA replication protein DnaC
VAEAMTLIRETYDNDTKRTERQAVLDLVEPDLLILDEVGLQKNSDWEHEKLYEIINGRYEREKPMIVMSNEDIDGLRAFLGERCVDRLREKGKALAFDWQSYRVSGGAA